MNLINDLLQNQFHKANQKNFKSEAINAHMAKTSSYLN